MEKFEYYTTDFLVFDKQELNFKTFLNLMGDDRWELITVKKRPWEEKPKNSNKKLSYNLVKKYCEHTRKTIGGLVEEEIEEKVVDEIVKNAVEYNDVSEKELRQELNDFLYQQKVMKKINLLLVEENVEQVVIDELGSKIYSTLKDWYQSKGYTITPFGFVTEDDGISDFMREKIDRLSEIIGDIDTDSIKDFIWDILGDINLKALEGREGNYSKNLSDSIELEFSRLETYQCFFKRKVM